MSLPAINIGRVLQLQVKIQQLFNDYYYACTLEGQKFHEVVDELVKLLKVDREPIADSLRNLAGTEIYDPHIEELSWRLAGNLPRLKVGLAVSPWLHQPCEEWVPVQVRAVYPATQSVRAKDAAGNKSTEWIKKRGVRFRLLVLAGLPAGRRFDKFLSFGYAKRIRLVAGFSRYDREKYSFIVSKHPNYALREVIEFTQTRLFVKLAATAPHEELNFTDVAGSGGCRNWNRALFRKRLRKTFPCPMAYDSSKVPCHTCPLGYDRCEAACHPRTYEARPCEKCGHQTWFDADVCVNCVKNQH